MGEVSRDPRVSSLRRLPLSAFTNLKDLLDRCQKSLDEYLEVLQISIFIIYYYFCTIILFSYYFLRMRYIIIIFETSYRLF